MFATVNLISFCFDILFPHSLMEHKEWGRVGSEFGWCNRLFGPTIACESCVLLGTCMFFLSENEAWGYSTVYQSVWLRLEDAWNKPVGWGVGGRLAVFPRAKGSAEMQYNSPPLLPCKHKASVNRPGPSVFLFTGSLFFHNPKLHFMYSVKSCIYE